MPTPVLPMPLIYDGTFRAPTVAGAAGSTSGAADQVAIGRADLWTDQVGGHWFCDSSGIPTDVLACAIRATPGDADFPYVPLTRPAVEAHGDQRILVTDFYGVGNHCVVLRYRDAAAYLSLAFYLIELRFDRLVVTACRSGQPDLLLLHEVFPHSLPNTSPPTRLRLDCAAIRFWPTRIFAIVTDTATGLVIADHVIEDSTPELQQPGVLGLANRDRSFQPDFGSIGSDGIGGYFYRVRLYGYDWHNQPVLVFFGRADAGNRAGASLVYSATVDLPRCRATLVYSARADLPRCNASLVYSATADASASVVLPHTYSVAAVASLVYSAESDRTIAPGVRVAAVASLVYSAESDCRVKHRRAGASLVFRAGAIEHATVRPVDCAAALLFRARARLRRPAAPSVPAAWAGAGYLGRFQAGDHVPLSWVSRDSRGVPVVPLAGPIARIYALDAPPWRVDVPLVRRRPPRDGWAFALSLPVGPSYPPGRYAILYRGSGLSLGTFEVAPGGDPAGAVIAAHAPGVPAGPRLVAQLDSGVLLVGARPSLP